MPGKSERCAAARRIEYDVKANWKLLVQNYSECYHCPLIHPALNQLSGHRTGVDTLTEGSVLGGTCCSIQAQRA